MITQEQFDRLPDELAEIVDLDRRMGNEACRPIVSFAEFSRLHGLRNEWRKVARIVWGHAVRTTVGGDGSAGAVRA